MGREVYGGDSSRNADQLKMYDRGVRAGALGLLLNSVVLGFTSLGVEVLARGVGGVKRLWGIVNFILAICLAMTILITKVAQSNRRYATVNGGTHLLPPPSGVKAGALALFAVMGIPQAITYSIPFALASIFSNTSGAGQGLSLGVLNLSIVIPQIPTWHYLVALLIISITFLYKFLEVHFFEDVFFKSQGTPITYNPSSPFCNAILSSCKILHSRFVATTWISSPHFQTAFLQFCGRSPVFSYRRHLFRTSDGGTIALDWLLNADVSGGAFGINGASLPMNNAISQDETTPIVVVVPGLASSSTSNVKYLGEDGEGYSYLLGPWQFAILGIFCFGGAVVLMDWNCRRDQNWYCGDFDVTRNYIFGFEVI
ncbi:hypothetical protein NC652_031658 [Populus alba x Populus x berolinensis]|nr:hypothetical protein NC652_031658 [Populus alba x Populus x berolinensis]